MTSCYGKASGEKKCGHSFSFHDLLTNNCLRAYHISISLTTYYVFYYKLDMAVYIVLFSCMICFYGVHEGTTNTIMLLSKLSFWYSFNSLACSGELNHWMMDHWIWSLNHHKFINKLLMVYNTLVVGLVWCTQIQKIVGLLIGVCLHNTFNSFIPFNSAIQ